MKSVQITVVGGNRRHDEEGNVEWLGKKVETWLITGGTIEEIQGEAERQVKMLVKRVLMGLEGDGK